MTELFQKVLEVFDRLGLWNDGVELIGSWTMLLYQRHCGVLPYPLRTQDVDFLIPRIYPHRNPIDLASALSPLGFQVGFTGRGAIHFIHPDLKVEFLTPERGKGDDRPRAFKTLGINAVQLRFLDLLFEHPLIVKEGSISVRIPTPIQFCIHKLLISQRRNKPDKAAKDIEQAVHLLTILEPKEFEARVHKLPRKWQAMIRKSLIKARRLVPTELTTIEKYDLAAQK